MHTPGPWTIVETECKGILSAWHIHVGNTQIPFFPYKRVFSQDRTQSGLVADGEQHANARLIAAAPQLLCALQRLTRPDDGRGPADDDLAYALDAIRAATGAP